MRFYASLSDVEFERLARDLLEAELGLPVEVFSRAADGGIDVRWYPGSGMAMGQCKHYTKSSFSQLHAAAEKEVKNVDRWSPISYRFITSKELTRDQKDKLFSLFSGYMKDPTEVWGAHDIDSTLDKHREVELRHVKLWLASGAHLIQATHSRVFNRSDALRQNIEKSIPNFAPTDSFHAARRLLDEKRVCVIAGSPGVGKTMLAEALAAECLRRNYSVVDISNDVDDGWELLNANEKQFFLYDDFLGELALEPRLGRGEDRRLVDFARAVAASGSDHRFVMTTREYILTDAEQAYARLSYLREHGMIYKMPQYSLEEKGKILYNHLWHSDALSADAKAEVAKRWKEIVNHPNYNPRIIGYGTGSQSSDDKRDQGTVLLDALDSPDELWTRGFNRQISDTARSVLIVLCAFDEVEYQELSRCLADYSEVTGATSPRPHDDLRSALDSLDGTFVQTSHHLGDIRVSFHSPAIREFMHRWLNNNVLFMRSLVRSARHISQLEQLSTATYGSIRVSTATSLNLGAVSEEFKASVERVSSADREPIDNKSGQSSDPDDRANTEARLLTYITSLPRELRPSGTWMFERLAALTRLWAEGAGSIYFCARLLNNLVHMDSLEYSMSDLLEAAKSLVSVKSPEDSSDWVAVHEIVCDLAGERFTASMTDEFIDFVVEEIGSSGVQMSNIGDLIVIAMDIGADSVLEDLEALASNIDELADRQFEESRDWSITFGESEPEDDLSGLFDRFSQ